MNLTKMRSTRLPKYFHFLHLVHVCSHTRLLPYDNPSSQVPGSADEEGYIEFG
jgi:hypothetical protein